MTAAFLSREHGHLIGGKWAPSVSGDTLTSVNPAAGWPSKFEGSTIPVSPRNGLRILNYTVHEPIGVVGAIVPWNFPMSMAAWKLAPTQTGREIVRAAVSARQLGTVRSYIESGLMEGATLAAGAASLRASPLSAATGSSLSPRRCPRRTTRCGSSRRRNLTDPASPFGGYKQSGWGREMGRAVLGQYTETKSVWVNLT